MPEDLHPVLSDVVDTANIIDWSVEFNEILTDLGTNKDQKFQRVDISPDSTIYRSIENADNSCTVVFNGEEWNPEIYEIFRGLAWAFDYEQDETDKQLYWVSDSCHADRIGVTSSASEFLEALKGNYALLEDFYSSRSIEYPATVAIVKTQSWKKTEIHSAIIFLALP